MGDCALDCAFVEEEVAGGWEGHGIGVTDYCGMEEGTERIRKVDELGK